MNNNAQRADSSRPNLPAATPAPLKLLLKIGLIAATGLFFFILFGLLHRTSEGDALVESKYAVRDLLKDAGSAEFRNLGTYRAADGSFSVCGEVNSRNSFGAMAGYHRFFYVKGGHAITEDATGRDVMDRLWADGGCNGSPLKTSD